MALAYEGNTDLAFDTSVLKQAGKDYADIAVELRSMAKELDKLIQNLKDKGWTTPAGTAFYAMVDTNWSKNIEKYAALLDTLKKILDDAVTQYDDLATDYIRKTKVNI